MPDNWALVRLRVLFMLALSTFFVGAKVETLLTPSNATVKTFYWIDIKPTQDLVWHRCYEPLERECARLSVPLNHLDQSSNNSRHGAIAIIRKPARFPSSDPRYRGPILFNPGGPGGSGVVFLNTMGDLLDQALGPEFDIVSFDPRGIGLSTPKVNFYGGVNTGEREIWDRNLNKIIRGGPNEMFPDVEGDKGRGIEETWAHAIVRNKLAGENAGDWLGNVNTEQTAYDMLSIVKAFGREKLMYWGISYGSVLGSTFATLFPDKVERVVLDGVVDTENYYATLWTNNLLTTDEALNQFFTTCHAAGPSSCAFWAPSPSLISANLTRIYKDLITNPIPVRSPTSYGILDYFRVRASVFSSLYSPWANWPLLAQALKDLGGPNRDPTKMWNITGSPNFKCTSCSVSCNDKDRREAEFGEDLQDAQTAIVCSDGLDTPVDLAAAKEYFNNFSRISDWADVWANTRVNCAGWPKAKKGFQGPVKGNTSFPILFIGNTADPVTPLVNAKLMSTRFPGSTVLTQDSPGHTSTGAPSVCTHNVIKAYFLNGTLPPEGTVCSVISSPFPNSPNNSRNLESDEDVNVGRGERRALFNLGGEDGDKGEQKIQDVVTELSRAWRPFSRAFL
ncbi:hypothetical protein P691DRAFT_727897 [Macrolepiota fuliginosa MF-IS2]|uniref:Peptidase S33 tripeptidyl aminopeptidase-like C-terminal domain-containing protein n=1 Tax=Macrolepiota fuliginosa MF-IS2 TaxID=1400762 RepID=A0A9P5XDN5_9AGAR|nr:hypothetical protein P691DRAFT_727897 [Macrolepiota fuliginosa MF-IS2]